MRTNTKLLPASTIEITTPDGHAIELDCVQCVHCGTHFPIAPGSGKIRGFCGRCNGPVCGPRCAECVPIEQWLENREQGRPDDHRPVRVSMGGVSCPSLNSGRSVSITTSQDRPCHTITTRDDS